MADRRPGRLGAVLAGGAGRRMGGASKAGVELGGRPLALLVAAALGEVCERVVVVCKAGTPLPELPPGIERWDEPDEPRHPAAGIAYALERAGGDVLVCATDMPFADAAALRALLDAGTADPAARAVIARAGGRAQPVLGLYRPSAAGPLHIAAQRGEALGAAVAGLGPVVVDLPVTVTTDIDSPADLRAAEDR